MANQKRKKRDPAKMHRQVQDSLQALPYALAEHEKQGRRGKALMLKYLGAPLLKLMDRFLSRSRYKGVEGAKLKQAELAKRHLEQRQQALKHVQGEIIKSQKQARRGKPR